MITFTKMTGDRECKACDILSDGVRIGSIERINVEGFQAGASMRRTMRFDVVEVYLLTGEEASFSATDGYDGRSAIKAARAWAS